MTRESGGDAPAFHIRDPEAFARNMTRLFEEAGRAAAAYAGPREARNAQSSYGDEMADVVKTLTEVSHSWLSTPERAMEAQARLWRGYVDLWSFSMKRLMGEPVDPIAAPDPKDNRFKDPDWTTNQLFDVVKQAYLLTSRWVETMVADAEGVDDHTRQKAAFYVKQLVNALAPSNFILTNPELLRETLASDGENLVRGMKLLAEDIREGGGDLKIRQTDPAKFRLGENLAVTSGKVVYQNELMQLIQYEARTETVLARPLLIVPPWINKYYVLDLNPEKSFISWLVEQGHTVFCISWVNPDEGLARKSFESYMREGVVEALDAVCKATRRKSVNAMGYCVGGTLLAVAAARLAEEGDERIASATLLTTQVDFTHAGDLKVFVDEGQLAALEKRMQERGYLEGRRMATAFNLLRSNDLIWPYVINNYLRGREPFPFDLLYWNSDSTRMPAANHGFYLRHCYLQNDLSQGRMEIGGKIVDLARMRVPVYNLATREDHIAPARSVFLGSRFFGGEVTFVLAGSGHIAGVVNPPARGKYQYWSGPEARGELDDWIGRADENPGSWWPHWQAWIEMQDSSRMKARKPGGGRLKVREDAPGSYVRVKA